MITFLKLNYCGVAPPPVRYAIYDKEIKIEIEGKGILGTIPFKSALPSILLKTMKN